MCAAPCVDDDHDAPQHEQGSPTIQRMLLHFLRHLSNVLVEVIFLDVEVAGFPNGGA